MIPVQYYATIYYLVITIVIVGASLPLLHLRKIANFPNNYQQLGSVFVLLITIGFIGLRDPHAPSKFLGDTIAYTRIYELIQSNLHSGMGKDAGFYAYMKLCSTFINVQYFYLLSAFLYVYLPFITFKKWFGDKAFFALMVFVASMSFWSFGVNGLRNGLASSFFIFALGFKDKKWIMYGFMLLSVTFHKSMMLPVAAFIIAQYYQHTNKLIIFWLLTIPVSLMFGQQIEGLLGSFLSSDTIFSDDRAGTFFSGETSNLYTEQKFRLDFVLYSAAPIILSWWILFKKKYQDKFYTLLVNTYLISNGAWILLIYVPFTNRLAYLSWFLMPIILIYPFIYKSFLINNNKWIFRITIGSLLFTLLMLIK